MRFPYTYYFVILLLLTGTVTHSAPVINEDPSTPLMWKVEPYYFNRTGGQPGRVLRIYVKDYSGPLQVKVTCESVTQTTSFPANEKENYLLLPAGLGVNVATNVQMTVTTPDKEYYQSVPVEKMRQWTIYIYPHSHLDIGYTALPSDVLKLQMRNIDVGIDIAEKTQAYPEGSRFVWNTEATWIVQHYWQQATDEQKKRLVAAVKKGWLQIDGAHSNSNTSTCSDEELIHFFSNAASLQKATGVPIRSMVQMDSPGAAWGMVTTAAQFGIDRFISFPNNYDVRHYWQHRPFYWLGPDGKTKMLFLQGFPYGIGYTIKGSKYGLGKIQAYTSAYDRVSTDEPSKNFLDPFIFEETEDLEKAGLPYDIFAMTWSMADNCVIDADLPEAVRQWNEKYAWPKLVITGTNGILDAFEKKYASVIPTYSGDFTEFWTNGLGSDAKSVAVGRTGKEKLVQAEILATLVKHPLSSAVTSAVWEDQLLSAEHTWGAQDSKSRLARDVEAIKSGYFINSARTSDSLVTAILSPFRDSSVNSFSVINTLSWARSGIVTLSAQQSRFGDAVVDEQGKQVLSQRLLNGELIFEAKDVPPMSSKLYRVVARKKTQKKTLAVKPFSLQNEMLSLELDPGTGNISSLRDKKNGYEYADSAGLNFYQYVKGVYNGRRVPEQPTTDTVKEISIGEHGPLLVSLRVISKGEGVRKMEREVRMYYNRAEVEVINRFDKISTRNKEAMHFGFSFRLPGADGHIDMPWSIVTPDENQIPRANRNWFAFQRWVDISNDQKGITWTAIDAPLVEWGALSGNVLDGARQPWRWSQSVPRSSTIYSWPLNNHWDTNFPLEQGGEMMQRYVLRVHEVYDPVEANRFGMEVNRPFIVVQAKTNVLKKPFVLLRNEKLLFSTITRTSDDKQILLRIRSISGKTEKLSLEWPAGKPAAITECNAAEEPLGSFSGETEVEPYGMKSLRVSF